MAAIPGPRSETLAAIVVQGSPVAIDESETSGEDDK
jgi:hypothetical protein